MFIHDRGQALVKLGMQILLLGLQGQSYLVARGLDWRDELIDWFQSHVTLERGLLVLTLGVSGAQIVFRSLFLSSLNIEARG